MAAILHFAPFSPNTEAWEGFLELFVCFLLTNDFHELSMDRKRGFFLSACGPEMFTTVQALAAPLLVHALPWDTLLLKLMNHHSPVPSHIARRHAIWQCLQKDGESVSQYMASLYMAAIHCQIPRPQRLPPGA